MSLTEPSSTPKSFMERWQRIARRIRVPLGFVAAILYLWELARHRPQLLPIAWSVLLVVPGLWLRSYAAGYVKKNRELTMTGPYAYTRNPLYLGSMLMAAGFAVALMSWAFALTLLIGFALIYIPVIASEEKFLLSTFPNYPAYRERVPRLFPRSIPHRAPAQIDGSGALKSFRFGTSSQRSHFSFELYRRHREYNSAIGAALLYCGLLLAIYIHATLGR